MRLSIACADRVLVSPGFLPFHDGFPVVSFFFFFFFDPLFAVPLQPRLLRCYPPLGEVVPSTCCCIVVALVALSICWLVVSAADDIH